ncbi:alpha/beta hydrolase fold domain-containing protein [Gordonia sp. PDNC005]|uniref:alpha/beta hydrolase n=1 Tax=unclassified Gordonia (in: high G+C Gram-positive bacteria) TaxID=2657482 RepID=UPI00196651EA|nr:alpha/beta hydrolase [Gordonia sp. PDNC005]QRY64239.1 alpha/beta hydrolase fold domain-containing protein [Gordonia sp. PDNC005]
MRLRLTDLVDPRLDAFAAESRTHHADIDGVRGPADYDELRAVRAQIAARPSVADPAARTSTVNGVPVRILEPSSAPSRGVYLALHGGGFYLGSAVRSDPRHRDLAESLNVTVVAPDYRLAPEHPWPAAGDDCETIARWLIDHAALEFGTGRLVIGGASAGATLALTTLLRLRDHDLSGEILGAVLAFGSYDISGQTPMGRSIADEYFIEAYVGHVDDRTHPDISPVFADLRGLPPALLTVGADDVVLEHSLVLAARLTAARADVTLNVYPDAPHAFTGAPTAMAAAAWDDIYRWIDGLL